MSTFEWFIAHVTRILLAFLILGVFRSKRYRYCYTFMIYLFAQLIGNILTVHFLPYFTTWMGWLYKEIVYALLRLSILAELTILVFRALPRARARAYFALISTGVAIIVALAWIGAAATNYDLARDMTSRFNYLTLWGLISVSGLVAWYHLPVYRFHKILLNGLLILLLSHIICILTADVLEIYTGPLFLGIQLVVLTVWNRAAWTRDTVFTAEERTVIRYLQPWRVT